jgi:hypothetical protein
MRGVLEALAEDLRSRADSIGRSLHRRQFRSCTEGGAGLGKTKRGKGTKIMAVAGRHGLPIAVCAESATPHQVKLVMQTWQRSLWKNRSSA